MHKKVWIGGGLIAVLALVLAVLFFVDFNSPRLGKALLDQVSAQMGLHVVVASLLRLDWVTGEEVFPIPKEKLADRLQSIRFEHILNVSSRARHLRLGGSLRASGPADRRAGAPRCRGDGSCSAGEEGLEIAHKALEQQFEKQLSRALGKLIGKR